jgi:hypothetical protein
VVKFGLPAAVGAFQRWHCRNERIRRTVRARRAALQFGRALTLCSSNSIGSSLVVSRAKSNASAPASPSVVRFV